MTLVLSLVQRAGAEVSLAESQAASKPRCAKACIKVLSTICMTAKDDWSFVGKTGLRERILLKSTTEGVR